MNTCKAIGTFDGWVQQLPQGRARQKYEHLSARLGETWMIQLAYHDAPIWLVLGAAEMQELAKAGVPRTRIWTLAQVQAWLEACGSAITTLEEAAHMLASECPA